MAARSALVPASSLETVTGAVSLHCTGRSDQYAELLREVCRRTARLVALWQCVGFTHGVLNTDNMSILGETIDYGWACVAVFGLTFTEDLGCIMGHWAVNSCHS